MEKMLEIDESTFMELKSEVGEDFLKEMVTTFCEDSIQQSTILRKALLDKNQADFTRAAHTLKSTSLIFGALNFGELAKELEQLGREGRFIGSDEKVQRMFDALIKLHSVLENLSNE